MLTKCARLLWGLTFLAILATGCQNSQPGSGFTNEPEPIYAPEKPAIRTDLPPPDRPSPDTEGESQPSPAPSGGSGSSEKAATPSRGPADTNPSSDAAGRTAPAGTRQPPR